MNFLKPFQNINNAIDVHKTRRSLNALWRNHRVKALHGSGTMLPYYLRMRRVNWVQFYHNFDLGERCRLIAHPISTAAVCRKEHLNKTSILKLKSDLFKSQKEKYEDTFGNLNTYEKNFMKIEDDPEDVKEFKRDKAAQGKKIPQYIKEVTEHLRNRDYKSALRVVEVDMYNDRKPPVAWIYTDLIMYNARIGNLEEAYRLYTNYKKFGGRMDGAMYTAVFAACQFCRNTDLALKAATAVREYLLNDPRIKPNNTHYRAMITAFGKHGDLLTCFKIFDEMMYTRDKVKAEDFWTMLNIFLNDRNAGLRHALLFWRKMIQYRVQPNEKVFHSLLDCVRHCSLGDVELLPDLIKEIDELSKVFVRRQVKMETVGNETKRTILKIPADGKTWYQKLPRKGLEKYTEILNKNTNNVELKEKETEYSESDKTILQLKSEENTFDEKSEGASKSLELTQSEVQCENEQTSQKLPEMSFNQKQTEFPNLIAFEPTLGCIVNFKALTKPQHRFVLLGGLRGFLKVMLDFGVAPDEKIFSQLLFLVPETDEAHKEVLALAKALDIKLNNPFFNALIKIRIFMGEDYKSVQKYIQLMQDHKVQPDIITFGTLALACVDLKSATELVKAVESFGFRVNGPIVNALLHKAAFKGDLEYVKGVLNIVKEYEVEVNGKFMSKLVKFVDKHKHLKDSKPLENKLYTYSTS